MTEDYRYIGSELSLFALAANWKAYIRNEIGSYVRGHVLEVGAGLGETAKALINGTEDSWTCLEPDSDLARRFIGALDAEPFAKSVIPRVIVGKIDHPACDRKFDTILYIDVLEHIEQDGMEIRQATQKLARYGNLVVLVPAHQYLFSPFDSKIGHFRRYNRKQLIAISPPETKLLRVRYLDSIGCLASLSNRLILRADLPTRKQIIIWDRLMVPLSRIFDCVSGHQIGKSLYAVWQKCE